MVTPARRSRTQCKRPVTEPARPFPWREIVLTALRAARTVVTRLSPAAGQRVVAGREAGYRPWDPEVIRVDTATERAVVSVLKRWGLRGTLLSEEAGEKPIVPRSGLRSPAPEPVYVIMDPFDGSLLYRRGIRAHWFTALGIYGMDEAPRAAGIVDHISGEIALADAAGAVRLSRSGTKPTALHPASTTKLDGAFLEAYMGKPAFLYAASTALRPLLERARFILPNGGPGGFADVAAGRIDVYVAWSESLTEVYSAAFIAERVGCVITHWDGSPVRFTPDIHAVYNLVCSANARLHRQVLDVLAHIPPPKGFAS